MMVEAPESHSILLVADDQRIIKRSFFVPAFGSGNYVYVSTLCLAPAVE